MSRPARPVRTKASAFTLTELLVVIGLLAVLISVLLPLLSNARSAARQARLAAGQSAGPPAAYDAAPPGAAGEAAGVKLQRSANADGQSGPQPPPVPLAQVKSFTAKVELTPGLSVGTAEPESIYEARCTATFQASAPEPRLGAADRPGGGGDAPVCEIHLPLPPQIISLADLSVTVGDRPSDTVALRAATLVWTGPLPVAPTAVKVTYTAVGKGLYELHTPPSRVFDTFDMELAANGSDLRMLELSLQPTNVARGSGRTTYTWNYAKLMFGRPIAVDVLGVAPVDRLGELRWLGPLSVVVFGLIVGLYAHAHGLGRFDRWMLLLALGAFTGAYPLMYFAQEFVPLEYAMAGSATLVLAIIAVRSLRVIGLRHTALGVVLPAAATMAVTLYAATHPQALGLTLTAAGIAVFVIAMALAPRLSWTAAAAADAGTDAAPGPRPTPAA